MGSEEIINLRFIYILLNAINFLCFFFIGKKIARTNNDKVYWRFAVWIVFSYAIVMGLRFGRMIDYNVYFDRYVSIGRNIDSLDYELTFRTICWFLYNIGIPYQGFICFCSVVIIFSVLYLLKDYRKYAPLALLLFLWEGQNVENFIRWFLGFSFYLLFVSTYINEKYKHALLFSLLAVTIHFGLFLMIGVTLVLSIVKKQIMKSWLVEVLFLCSLMFGTVQMFGFLSQYIAMFGIDEKSTLYANQFQDIITGEFGLVGMQDSLSFSNIIRKIFAYSFPIFLIPKLLKKELIHPVIANLFIVGVILAPMFTQVEIMNRFGEGLLFFSIIVSAASYNYILKERKNYPRYVYWFCILSIFANIWPVLSGILNRTDWWTMMYIWDANGRDVVPLHYFLQCR